MNPATGLCLLISCSCILLWLIANIGVILNKTWGEECADLFTYLLLMSFLCLGGVLVYMYLSFVRYASDTRWLILSAVGAITAISLGIFLCWGIVKIFLHSTLLGVYQCFDCLPVAGTNVTDICTTANSCDPTSWKLIYTVDECTPAIAKGISCELNALCYYTAPNTFWYATVATGLFAALMLMTGGVIFTRLIPSFVIQSIQRSKIN